MSAKKFASFAMAASLLFAIGCATHPESQVRPTTIQSSAALIGTWDVSLRFDPTSPPSKTAMVISAVSDGALKGTFYGTEFAAGRVVSFSNAWVIAGRTGDASGAYWHSGRLQPDGNIEGQTFSEGRNFLMTWNAVKK